MKNIIAMALALISLNSFAACKLGLKINLFSNPYADIDTSKQLKKIKKKLKSLGHTVVAEEDATYLV